MIETYDLVVVGTTNHTHFTFIVIATAHSVNEKGAASDAVV
jgi:hypothetical protein